MASGARQEQAIVQTRLSLLEEGTKDRTRRAAARVPQDVPFRTRHERAFPRRDEHGPLLPPAWVAGDEARGRPAWFRLEWRGRGQRSRRAVPATTQVRDGEAPPESAGHGRRPQSPIVRRDRGCVTRSEDAGTTIAVRAGTHGPLVIEAVPRRVPARTPSHGLGPAEWLFRTRERQAEGTDRRDYSLSNADPDTPRDETNWRAWPRRRIASKSAASASRGKRGWPTPQCGTGWPGIITKLGRCGPRSS
jgi:hypothetical protein